MKRLRVSALCVLTVAVLCAPVAGADPGSPSYNLGKRAIDEQVRNHVKFAPDTDWQQYCQGALSDFLRSGRVAQVNSPDDFIAGCQDEGRAVAA